MITVPAWTIDALGGLRDEDPPVLCNLAWTIAAHHPQIDNDERLLDSNVLLLPQSAPALLVLLDRAQGHSEGSAMEVPRLTRRASSTLWAINGWPFNDLPESIQDLTDPLVALAAIFEWTAWLHRLCRLQWIQDGDDSPYEARPLGWMRGITGWKLMTGSDVLYVYGNSVPGMGSDSYDSLKAVVAHLESTQ